MENFIPKASCEKVFKMTSKIENSPNSLKSSNQNSLLSDYKINGKIPPLNGSKTPAGSVKSETFEFEIPPEAPVFYPSEEEFKDPLAYINKIRPAAENTGICKIKPPANWQPPFAVDVDKLRFTPRIQRLNELEAKTRVKLNFLDQIAKFWELQGSALRIPMVEKRALDLYTLHRLVQKEGGSDVVSKDRKWSKIAGLMGYPVGKGIGTILKTHYERLLYPYDVFKNGKSVSISVENSPPDSDRDYKPHGIVGRMNVKPPNDKHFRRSKRYEDDSDSKPEINTKDTTVKLEPTDDAESDRNKELKRLQFYGAGPKMAGFNIKNGGKMKSKNSNCDDPLAKYVCQHCSRGDVEESMLLCDGCDDSYHTFCLMPPLTEIPKGDWRCPSCVAVEVSKPTEAFGFEQAQREYSLQQFGEMADQFKSDYFNSPVHLVRTCDVEREFWRIVSSIDEDVTVEYGADLHTMDHGSGFPTSTSINLMPGDIEYADSQWNLNNLPVLEGSVLGYINADISGMKVPWMYVGMCFSTFCWHNEDHWSYSINYLHWGEPKTWYGVPGTKAIAFEETMKSAAPELFHSQPDLLHQLVTIMNPNILMSAGVPVFRTDQNAGEFVVTFPRAYHAGFNQGYNFAEAVNFAPADWLKMGRECIQHYSILRRFCVFSHDELVCKMALEPEKLTPLIAASLYEDMLQMVDSEKRMRKNLLDWGVTNALRESFELYPDDERQCEVCKTTCFLSAITCSCSGKTIVCLRHFTDLCECPPSTHTLRYRYTLDELPKMLSKLKIKAEAFDLWLSKVRDSLDPCVPSSLTLNELKGLLDEAEEKNFPKSDLLATLSSAIEDAEKCASVIRQLDSTMARTRTRNSTDRKYHLNLEELNLFIGEIESLACILEEAQIVKDLLEESNKFETNSQIFMNMSLSDCSCVEIEKCLEHGEAICIELPSLNIMRERLRQVKWLEDVNETREKSEPLTKDVINRFIESGELLNSDVLIEKELNNLRTLLSCADNWEVRAQEILSKPHPELISEIELLLTEAKQINAFLPTEKFLIESVDCVKHWSKQLDEINAAEFYPYINVVENLIQKGRTIPLPIPHVSDLEQYVIAGYNWRDKTSRIFLRKNSILNLLDALSPRHPSSLNNVKARRKPTEEVQPFVVTNEMEPVDVVNTFKEAEERELEGIRQLRNINSAKSFNVESDSKFCVCQRNAFGVMMRCELCQDWFHSTCVTLPKIANIKVKGNFTATSLRLGFKDSKFLCPCCFRTKRPRLETILSLLVSLQKLSVRIPEGEALQCLTERAMTWQDRVKQLLQTTDIEIAMSKLSLLTQKYSEAAARQKTEKIISSELKKAASNPDLKQHLHDIASWSGITPDSADSALEVGECTSTVSSSQDDTIDEHAYSLHIPNIDSRDYILKLPNSTQQILEDILLEGDLLEVSLDETLQLWKLIQVSRDPEKEPVLMDFSNPSKTSLMKKTRKRRSEEIDVRKIKQFKADGVKKLTKRKTKTSKDAARKQRSDANNSRRSQGQSSSDDEVEEKCASVNCLQPSSDEVDWVQCDGGCEQWFHMACVGLSAQEINEDEDYICMACSRSSIAFENLQGSPESQLSDNPQSPDSTQPLSTLKEV